MGELFWNKVAGAVLATVLGVLAITELGHLLVPSHAAHELTAENTAYPVDWAALDSGQSAEVIEEGPTDYGLVLAAADVGAGERAARRCAACHTFDQGGSNGVGGRRSRQQSLAASVAQHSLAAKLAAAMALRA